MLQEEETGRSIGRTVVVIGASGNVGTSVVQALASDPGVGAIRAVARRLPEWSPPKTEWTAADISTDDLADVVRGADAVVQLAWAFQPTRAPEVTWRTNVLGSIRVFEAVAAAGVPALVYASSVGAYSPVPAAVESEPVDEQWPTHGWPGAAYTREKSYLERVLDTYERQHPDIRVVRLRTGFVFKREAAIQQLRLFGGPFVPRRLIREQAVPVVPDLPGLRFQALHASDAGQAYRLAVTRPVRGAFNIAADPVVDARLLAECLGARVVSVPLAPARAALAALWRMHVVPTSPDLLDAVLQLPIMATDRAHSELGWFAEHSSQDTIRAMLAGLRDANGFGTPPLSPPGAGSRMRGRFAPRRHRTEGDVIR